MLNTIGKRSLISGTLLVLVSVFIGIFLFAFLNGSADSSELESSIPLQGGHFSIPGYFGIEEGNFLSENYAAITISIFSVLGIIAKAALEKINYETSMWRAAGPPLLACPIIVSPTYSLIATHPDGFMAALFAFQNGFFWQTMFESFRKK